MTPGLPGVPNKRLRVHFEYLEDTDWSLGMKRDMDRSLIPPGGCYDSADFMHEKPGIAYKRGGYGYAPGGNASLSGAAACSALAFGDFPAGSKIVAIGDNNHLFTATPGTTSWTDVGALGSAYIPVERMKLRVGGGTKYMLICANDGSSAPKTFDGTSIAALGGTPPAGKYSEIYKTRFALAGNAANPNRIYWSPTPDPGATWDTTNAWIDCDYQISGLASLRNVFLVFSQGHTERIIGSSPPPGSDMDRATLFSVGCTDARSIVVLDDNAIFANPHGIYMTNGAALTNLTMTGGISKYWQSLFSGYSPSTWSIACGVHQGAYLFVAVLDGSGNLITFLMCNMARRAWWRLTNMKPTCFASSVGINDELYWGFWETNRVGTLSGIFTPTSSNKNDANGTAVTPFLETRPLVPNLTVKHYGYGWVDYELVDAASDNPTLAITTCKDLDYSTFAAVPESPLAKSSSAKRQRVRWAGRGEALTVRVQQTNASASTVLNGIEAEYLYVPYLGGGNK